jgi:hypothetical protein
MKRASASNYLKARIVPADCATWTGLHDARMYICQLRAFGEAQGRLDAHTALLNVLPETIDFYSSARPMLFNRRSSTFQ